MSKLPSCMNLDFWSCILQYIFKWIDGLQLFKLIEACFSSWTFCGKAEKKMFTSNHETLFRVVQCADIARFLTHYVHMTNWLPDTKYMQNQNQTVFKKVFTLKGRLYNPLWCLCKVAWMSLCDCTGHVSFYITCLFDISVSVTCSFVLLWLFLVLSPYAFSICDTSDPQYEPYQYGGIAKQVKASSTLLTFVSCHNFNTLRQRCLLFSCSGLPQKCPLLLSLAGITWDTA